VSNYSNGLIVLEVAHGGDQFGYVSASGTISWLRSLPFERGTVFPSEFLRR
jgi:hypothetical protein